MVEGDETDKIEFGTPEIDEGWWNSVLADEHTQSDEPHQVNCKPCPQGSAAPGINWECMEKLFKDDAIVLLTVQGFNRGGLLVQGEGVQGFVPISHLVNLPANLPEQERNSFLEGYEGKSLYLKIIECEPSSERIVFSERAAQAGQGKRRELFESLKPGSIVCGVITNVTEFGAFVDLGGAEGLIHVSEISWGRVENPTAVLQIGQKVKVVVLQVNTENSRIALSLKRLSENPWDEVERKYQTGDVVDAQITSIQRFGAFARLDEGIEGLIHISSMPENLVHSDLRNSLNPGQPVRVKILHIDTERRRLGLGLVSSE